LTENTGTDVRISWSYPNDNSDPITQYLIEIRHANSVDFIESPECDGSHEAVVLARSCLVSLQSLRSERFSLTFDMQVVARLKSLNSFGWSPMSDDNTGGATILVEPKKMFVPIYKPTLSTG
jgi:hypothetical protein